MILNVMINQAHFLSFISCTLLPQNNRGLMNVDHASSFSNILKLSRKMMMLRFLKFLLLLVLVFVIILILKYFMNNSIICFLFVCLDRRRLLSLGYCRLLIFNSLCLFNLFLDYCMIYLSRETLILWLVEFIKHFIFSGFAKCFRNQWIFSQNLNFCWY